MSTDTAQFMTDEDYALLRRTKCRTLTDDEFGIFRHAIERFQLDPFTNQIYAQVRNAANEKRAMNIQTGIDGYRLIADRTGKYAGNDDPIHDNEEKPRKATVTVYKIVGNQRCSFSATARWEQYYPGDYLGAMWRKMPHLMLGKCAEALALRKAFPAELSGLYTTEEMQQADRDAKTSPLPPSATPHTIVGGATMDDLAPKPNGNGQAATAPPDATSDQTNQETPEPSNESQRQEADAADEATRWAETVAGLDTMDAIDNFRKVTLPTVPEIARKQVLMFTGERQLDIDTSIASLTKLGCFFPALKERAAAKIAQIRADRQSANANSQ